MKNLQELYAEIIGSDELKQAFVAAAKEGKVAEFLKAQGCESSVEEITAFLKETADQPLSDAELDSVTGGGCNDNTWSEVELSVCAFGVGCVIGITVSVGMGGSPGQRPGHEDEDGRLCN